MAHVIDDDLSDSTDWTWTDSIVQDMLSQISFMSAPLRAVVDEFINGPTFKPYGPSVDNFVQTEKEFPNGGQTWQTELTAVRYRAFHLVRMLEDHKFPVALHDSVMEFTTFYFLELHPYLLELGPDPVRESEMEGIFTNTVEVWSYILDSLCNYGTAPNRFAARIERKLVREAQFELLRRVRRSMMKSIRACIVSKSGVDDVYYTYVRFEGLVEFITGDDFRSERLERLILEYLDEDDEGKVCLSFTGYGEDIKIIVHRPNSGSV
jgi:hypothetical protein